MPRGVRLAGLAALGLALAPHGAVAQDCAAGGLREGRALVIGGTFTVVQIAAIATRHGDWWLGEPRGLHFSWGGSASRWQDFMLHGAVSYQLARAAAWAWDWACADSVTAGWLGALTSFAAGLPKEIGDGIHENGFSGTDMLWAGAGAALPALHRQWPGTRVATVKAWYWPSREFRNRTGAFPQLENDYAGQRLFLTLNPARKGGAGAWPDWLGIAVGHSVPAWISEPPVHRWYVVLDVDLRGVGVQADWWRPVAAVLDQIHFPAPGVRLTRGRVEAGLF